MLPIRNLLGHKYRIISAVVFQLWATIMMLMPSSGFPSIEIPNIDKLAHIGIYFLSFLLWVFSFFQGKSNVKYLVFSVITLLLFYGMVIEVVQGRWIPDRTFDLWDIVANLTGLIIGIVVFYIIKPFWPAKN